MRRLRRGLLVAIIIILICMTLPTSMNAGDPQPAVDNNVLYLHHDSNIGKEWMNADADEPSSDYWYKKIQISGSITVSFPLEPRLNNSRYLIMDNSQNWTIRVHLETEGLNPELQEVRGTLIVGDHSATSNMPTIEGDYYIFELPGGWNVIDPSWDIIFKFQFETIGVTAIEVYVYTDGTSTVTMPIIGVDTDTDGDGTVNSMDPDDDDDGYTDLEEGNAGTDPLDPDSHPSTHDTNQKTPLIEVVVICIVVVLIIAIIYFWKRKQK